MNPSPLSSSLTQPFRESTSCFDLVEGDAKPTTTLATFAKVLRGGDIGDTERNTNAMDSETLPTNGDDATVDTPRAGKRPLEDGDGSNGSCDSNGNAPVTRARLMPGHSHTRTRCVDAEGSGGTVRHSPYAYMILVSFYS